MKQKKTEDSLVNIDKPSVRKTGTILGSCAVAAVVLGSVCVFSLTGKSAQIQKETKAAVTTSTTTTSVTEAETESDETFDTMEWRKAGIDEYEMTEVKKEAAAKTTKKTTAEADEAEADKKEKKKETKLDNVKLISTEIVNLRADKSTSSDVLAVIGSGEFVTASAGDDEWYTVTYGGQQGYVMAKYFTEYSAPEKVEVETQAAEKKEAAKTETKPAETTAPKTTTAAAATTTKAAATTTKAAAQATTTGVISYTQEEFNMLCCVLQGEVGYCSEQSKIAVANVVINRVKSSKFPNSINGVLTAPNQFTAIYGYYNGTVTPTENTKACALRALQGEDNSNGAVYYYSPKYCSGSTASWFESLTFCTELDGQRYFK
ncbi:MAG: cell wall hydrolase [Ruminococcus sp.]|nr:cell wall hydrolase [Ruminococcus sp.]